MYFQQLDHSSAQSHPSNTKNNENCWRKYEEEPRIEAVLCAFEMPNTMLIDEIIDPRKYSSGTKTTLIFVLKCCRKRITQLTSSNQGNPTVRSPAFCRHIYILIQHFFFLFIYILNILIGNRQRETAKISQLFSEQ